MRASRLLPCLAIAMTAFPVPALAQGWEPSRDTALGFVAGGLMFAAFTYVAQALVWGAKKIGLGDLGVMLGMYSAESWAEVNLVFLRVLRYAAVAGIGIGLFAWMVGWAKGTL